MTGAPTGIRLSPAVAARAPMWRLLLAQVRYADRGFWREPVAAFFTLVFPLSFLVVLSAIVGNAVIDEASGLRLAQFVTPAFAVFGVCMASYVSLATAVAYARESGVLKRMRGAPVPASVQIGGRVLSALWVSTIAVVLLVGVGVAFYGVQIVWRTVPAVILTFIIGVACFAALGLAVAGLAPTPAATQAITNGSLILLAFVSGMFAFGELPDWVERIGDLFPLRHFVLAVSDAFNPYLDDSGLYLDHLAVMLLWGAAGAVVAVRYFRWEPRHDARASRRGAAGPAAGIDEPSAASPQGAVPVQLSAPSTPGSPSVGGLVLAQTRYAVLAILRDPMSIFFSMVFPVLLLAFFGSLYGSAATWGGMPLPQYVAAAFAVYGIAVMAYVNLAGSVAEQRSRLVLKRMRGTPLPSWAYLVGRVAAALVLGLLTVLLVFAVGMIFFDVALPPGVWPATLLVFVLGIVCFCALGLLLASLPSSPQTVIAISLATLLPLSFVSDIFISTTELPPLMNAIGWTFPLRHVTAAAVTASSGGALDGTWWAHVGVVLLWAVLAAVLARLLFRWEPRH